MTNSYPTTPTITINVPSTPSRSSQRPTSPIKSRATPPRIQTPPTATLINHSIPKSCYLCDEQNPGDFTPTTKYLENCLLCSREFCPIHKSSQWPDTSVCNINHSAYYHECLEEARKIMSTRPGGTLSGGMVDEGQAEELLVRDGVFPSLGEREKAIFTRCPVTDDQMRQLEEYRSLGAEVSGTKGLRRSALIETKEFIGADIAV